MTGIRRETMIAVSPVADCTANSCAETGIPARVVKVADTGRHRIVETEAGGARVHLLSPVDAPIPEGEACLSFDPSRTRVYADGWLAETAS